MTRLVVRKMPNGTFAAADTLQNRIVQDGFKSAAEAEKFIIWLVALLGHPSRSTNGHTGVVLTL
jgi:hypothetical protein